MQAVADYLREVGVAGLVVVGLGDAAFSVGSNRTVPKDDGIVFIECVCTHAALYLCVGSQGLVVPTKSHLSGCYQSAGGECLTIACFIKERKIRLCLLFLIRHGMRLRHESPGLGTAEVQIAVTVVGVIAP